MATTEKAPRVEPRVLQHIQDALATLQYGIVEITVHDGRVVQIERREKFRIEAPPRPRG